MKKSIWFVASANLLLAAAACRADDFVDLSITNSLTVSDWSWLKGTTTVGTLSENNAAGGFSMDVVQGSTVREEQVWVEREETTTQYIPVYGWVPGGGDIYVEEYGWIDQSEWIDGQYVGGFPGYWDDNGTPEDVLDDVYVDGDPGSYVPGHYESHYVWTVTGGHWEQGQIWAQTGTEPQSQTQTVGLWETRSVTEYSAPLAQFTGTRPNTTWVWRNPVATGSPDTRNLMVLSDGGLSFPYPGDAAGRYRAALGHSAFEQSWAGPDPEQPSTYQSFGSRLSKDGVEAWAHTGSYVTNGEGSPVPAVTGQMNAKVRPEGLVLEHITNATSTGVTANVATIIGATSSQFSGVVTVKGVARFRPQGGLSMGQFKHDPYPDQTPQ